jgi:hypothetical protein
MPKPIAYTTDGYYIVQVDTGIGEQYACIQIITQQDHPVPANWNPLDGFSAHHKAIVGGPGATPEAAWALWRGAQPAASAFKS